MMKNLRPHSRYKFQNCFTNVSSEFRWHFSIFSAHLKGGENSLSGVYASEIFWINSNTPLEDHPLDTHCEPSAIYCWILEILYCTPKGRRALLRIPTSGRAKCLSMLGAFKT